MNNVVTTRVGVQKPGSVGLRLWDGFLLFISSDNLARKGYHLEAENLKNTEETSCVLNSIGASLCGRPL